MALVSSFIIGGPCEERPHRVSLHYVEQFRQNKGLLCDARRGAGHVSGYATLTLIVATQGRVSVPYTIPARELRCFMLTEYSSRLKSGNVKHPSQETQVL